MTIAELMDQMEKEDGRMLSLLSSSNGGLYGDDGDDYDDEDTEVLVTYKVSSAAEAIRFGQALGTNVLIVDPPPEGVYAPTYSLTYAFL